MSSFEFEIQDKFDISFGPVILLKYLGDLDFGSLSHLNGVKILNIQIPRKVDKDGNLTKGLWAFHLDESADLDDFQIGEIVEAK